MNNKMIQFFPVRLALSLGLLLCMITAPVLAKAPVVNKKSLAQSTAEPALPNSNNTQAMPVEAAPSRQAAGTEPEAGKAVKGKRKQQAKPKKVDSETLSKAALPVLEEIMNLSWETQAEQSRSDETRKVSLEKIFNETLGHSIPVRQAEVQVEDSRKQAKEAGELNLFNLLNPIQPAALKQAAENNVQAAETHLLAVRQQELLKSTRLHADLLQSFMSKYLAFQAIEQGKVQLKADQQRFNAGETDRFALTQSEMALIDRYERFLKADNAYHMSSLVLASQIDSDTAKTLVPEGFTMQDGDPAITPLQLIPADFTLESILKMVRNRPDAREFQFRREALKLLIKASSGLDRQKKEAELHQLELEIEKGLKAAEIMAEKAHADYRLAGKGVNLARQRFDLANRAMRQLEISQEAGFSSSKDVLDGQVELARAKTALIGAQVAYNLSQIQLIYEMGLLSEDIFSRPLAIPPNLL